MLKVQCNLCKTILSEGIGFVRGSFDSVFNFVTELVPSGTKVKYLFGEDKKEREECPYCGSVELYILIL